MTHPETFAGLAAKLDRIIEMLENPKPYVPACIPGHDHAFTGYKGWRCVWCDTDGKDIMAWWERQERAKAEKVERDLYTLSYLLGIPTGDGEHVAFCTLPPDHPPGCGITASGAMHPESDAAKRYQAMRS